MKKHRIICSAAAVLVGLSAWAQAELPVSLSTGITPVVITGGTKYSTIGLPYHRQPLGRAVVTAVSGAVVTHDGAGLGTIAPNTHSVLFLTGSNYGRAVRISSYNNATQQITLAATVTGIALNADELMVIPDHTFASVFGAGADPSGLKSDLTPGSADWVFIADGGALVPYFHNGTNWRRVSGSPANANNLSLGGLNAGCLVLKRSPGNITLNISGVLRSGKQLVDITPGFSIVTFTDVGNTTLGASGLTGPGGLAANSDPNLADKVTIPNASGDLVSYFNNTSNWRRVAGSPANQNSLAVQAHRAIIVNKISSGTFRWPVLESFTE